MPQLLGNILSTYQPSNPYRQPCFAIWSNNGSFGGFSTFDHNYNCIGRMIYNDSAYGASRMRSTGAPEIFDTYGGTQHNLTNFVASSNGDMCKGTASCGYLGNISISMGDGFSGDLTGTTGYQTYRAVGFRDCATIVNEVDQRYAIWWENAQMTVGPRSANWYAYNRQILNSNRTNVSNKQSGYGSTKYGMASYNAKTNQLAVVEANGGYGFRPTVYNNVPRLAKYFDNIYFGLADQATARAATTEGTLYDHFNNASNYTTSYAAATGKPTNGSTEDLQRGIIVMCDDGKIVMFQMISSWGFWTHRWNANGTAAGNIISNSWTTSYGIDQGTRFGARWCVSSDGRYVMAWCASYYYGSGYWAVLIRVSDGKTLYDFNQDSTYGYQFCPIGPSSFHCMRDVNSDGGSGCYAQHIDADYMMNTSADLARVNFGRSNLTQLRGGNFWSTDYPAIIPLIYDTKMFAQI